MITSRPGIASPSDTASTILLSAPGENPMCSVANEATHRIFGLAPSGNPASCHDGSTAQRFAHPLPRSISALAIPRTDQSNREYLEHIASALRDMNSHIINMETEVCKISNCHAKFHEQFCEYIGGDEASSSSEKVNGLLPIHHLFSHPRNLVIECLLKLISAL